MYTNDCPYEVRYFFKLFTNPGWLVAARFVTLSDAVDYYRLSRQVYTDRDFKIVKVTWSLKVEEINQD